ncbi:hypothetical protein Tco_1500106 [Tanacetum coccineum]
MSGCRLEINPVLERQKKLRAPNLQCLTASADVPFKRYRDNDTTSTHQPPRPSTTTYSSTRNLGSFKDGDGDGDTQF